MTMCYTRTSCSRNGANWWDIDVISGMRLFLMNGFFDEFAFPCHGAKVNSDDYVDKKLMNTASFEAKRTNDSLQRDN